MKQDVRNRMAESIIVIAVLVAAWFVLVQPFQERAERGAARVRSLEAELESYKAAVNIPPEQARQYLERMSRLVALASPRPALADHEQILGLARRNGLDLERISPSADETPTRLGPIITGSRRFQIETEGSFARIAAFLASLSSNAPMTVVDHFAIHAPDPTDPDGLVLTAGVKVGRISTERFDVAEVRP